MPGSNTPGSKSPNRRSPAPGSASAQSSSSKDAHLARVRENQRRSRARRKEYLADLEDKFRSYKERGVTATAEMQVAARRVLAENRRLRLALRSRGMSERDIDALALDKTEPGASSSGTATATDQSSAAADLGVLLGRAESGDDVEGRRRTSSTSLTPEPSYNEASQLTTPQQRQTQQQLMPARRRTVDAVTAHEPLGVPSQDAAFSRRVSGSGQMLAVPSSYQSATSMPYPYQSLEQQQQVNSQAYMGQGDSAFTGQMSNYANMPSQVTPQAMSGVQMQGPGYGGMGMGTGGLYSRSPTSASPVSSFDMSELLSPELQAQFQAALEESTAAVRRASDYGEGPSGASGGGSGSSAGAGEAAGASMSQDAVWGFERKWI